MHSKDKQGIQKNVQYSTDQYREHPCVSKSLAVDKRVHSQSDHHKQGSQKIDPYVVCRIGKGYITGAKGIEDRSVKDKPMAVRIAPVPISITKVFPMSISASSRFPLPRSMEQSGAPPFPKR